MMPVHLTCNMVLFWLMLATLAGAYELPICNTHPYGRPGFADCLQMLQTFANGHDGQLRIFDEEQLRSGNEGSWPGIRNPFRAGVVQVPKFWSRGECLRTRRGWNIDICADGRVVDAI